MEVMLVTRRIAVHSLRAEACNHETGNKMAPASRTRMGVHMGLMGMLCGWWFESLDLTFTSNYGPLTCGPQA